MCFNWQRCQRNEDLTALAYEPRTLLMFLQEAFMIWCSGTEDKMQTNIEGCVDNRNTANTEYSLEKHAVEEKEKMIKINVWKDDKNK